MHEKVPGHLTVFSHRFRPPKESRAIGVGTVRVGPLNPGSHLDRDPQHSDLVVSFQKAASKGVLRLVAHE